MKKNAMTGLLTLVTLGFATATAVAADLAITLTGIRSTDGRVMVAVYDRPDAFMKTGGDVAALSLAARADEMTVVLVDVAPGAYAVSAYHDENGNGELDTNLVGMPTEGYGFSNDAAGSFGPPAFDAAAVTVTAGKAAASVTLRY